MRNIHPAPLAVSLAIVLAWSGPVQADGHAVLDSQPAAQVSGKTETVGEANNETRNVATDEGKSAASGALTAVVVTATRGAKAVDRIPGAVTVIGQQELAAQYLIADDPSQALATFVPGYAPSRQKMTSTGESLRGRQPLILLDGIPQSNPLRAGMREGYFADSAIIERIEVINGASAMQGLGATGGIINYITKSPRQNGSSFGVHLRAASQFRSDNLDWKAGYSLQHKDDNLDLLGYVGLQGRGMGYDGDGRRLGIDNVQGDTLDTRGDDLFIKIGKNFGAQRIQASINRFNLDGQSNYSTVAGRPTTSAPGRARGEAPRNRVRSASIDYRHSELAGGAFTAQLFRHGFEALYGATAVANFQDPLIALPGSLYDQSEIVADKVGARLTFVRPDTVVRGLEMTAGLDYLRDDTEQRLAATGRTWVPKLQFTSTAPFAQLEYETGNVTVRGGVRYEMARLHVDTYTTLAAYKRREVQGGSTEFSKAVKNLGAVWRFAPGWSVFAGSAEGFGLPDAGLVLRAVDLPGQSVASLVQLQPIVTRNNEVGINWRGARGQLGLSRYDSRSRLGSLIRINAEGVGRVERLPVVVKGWELSGDWRVTRQLSLFGSAAVTDGKTAIGAGAPLDIDLGARSQGPDKATLGANWQPLPRTAVRLQAAYLHDRNINFGRKAGSSNLQEDFNGYTLVDMAASYDSAYGKLGVSVENLLDRSYIGYYAQSANGRDLTASFAGRGRTLAVSWSRMY